MPGTRSEEIEQLKAHVAELQEKLMGNGNYDRFKLPDPIKNMSEYTGNKKELAAWLEELDELYEMYVIKGEEDEDPDTMPSHYLRAIKNKIKGDARTVLCANGNPNTIPGIRRVLVENYGDQRDLATNLSHLFHVKRGDRNNLKFYNDMKELSSKLKTNLSLNPIEINNLIEILILTKYLDNIGEPLASIIRQSKPVTLEEAYQAVCINQNAEARNRPAYSKYPHQQRDSNYKNKFTSNGDGKPDPRFKSTTKPSTQHKYKPKVEVHNHEAEEKSEEDDDILSDIDNDDSNNEDVTDIQQNFQSVHVTTHLTWTSFPICEYPPQKDT